MSEKMVFASGYPIGFITINNEEYYSIQLNDNMYPVNLLSAFLWLEALKGGATKIDIMDNVLEDLQKQGYELGKDFTLENLEMAYTELLHLDLLIEVDNSELEIFFEKYPEIVPYRVGFGLGMDTDKIAIHNENQNIEITSIEYYIWQLSNGSRTLKIMYKEYEKGYMLALSKSPDAVNEYMINDLKRVFMDAFIGLYKNNLIYVSNI